MVKNLPANAGDTSSIPGQGRSPGEGSSILEYILHLGSWDSRKSGSVSDISHGIKRTAWEVQCGDFSMVSPGMIKRWPGRKESPGPAVGREGVW